MKRIRQGAVLPLDPRISHDEEHLPDSPRIVHHVTRQADPSTSPRTSSDYNLIDWPNLWPTVVPVHVLVAVLITFSPPITILETSTPSRGTL
jgi:hypothetical protein